MSQPCPPNVTRHSRPLSQGPLVKFIHLSVGTVALTDVQVNTPPVPPLSNEDSWTLCVVSCDPVHLDDSLYLHFNPLFHAIQPGGIQILPTGGEEWFPFVNGTTGYNKLGQFWRFQGPVPPILWFDIGHETGGGAYLITLAIGFEINAPGNAFSSTP